MDTMTFNGCVEKMKELYLSKDPEDKVKLENIKEDIKELTGYEISFKKRGD